MATSVGDLCSCVILTAVNGIKVKIRYWGGQIEDIVDLLKRDAKEQIEEAMKINHGITGGSLRYDHDRGDGFNGEWSTVKPAKET